MVRKKVKFKKPKRDTTTRWQRVVRDATAPRVDRRSSFARLGGADDWIKTGRWVGVKSSNVAAIRYDRISKRLFVQFRGGATYRYENVPKRTALDLFYADSVGRAVWQKLRDRFSYGKYEIGRIRI